MCKENYWIWYPGDMELYYAMKQNFSRVERGFGWPAFWKSEGFRNRVAFRRTYSLKEETSFCVYSNSVGYVLAGEQKYAFGKTITCKPGDIKISIHAGCIEEFPAVYIEGERICSDEKWMVEDYDTGLVPVGYSRYFTRKEQRPSQWEYSKKTYLPVLTEQMEDGVLFGFETELTAVLRVTGNIKVEELEVFCGESREEALDTKHCYYSWHPDAETGECPCCAVRYAYIPGCRKEEIFVTAVHQYVDIPVAASFRCEDELLNRIWDVCVHTFRLCSGIFFVDGVKRDKWIWSGDAYQSFFVNQYLMADEDINRRTLLALRGNDHMTTHINTIVDYTLMWILGVKEQYENYKDVTFVRQVYGKMKSLMEFCMNQLDEEGFIVGRENDWIYIDWADLDKEWALCAEQMLLAQCYRTMEETGKILGESWKEWAERYENLIKKIQERFWDEEKHAFIDSFASGKRHVTRHANIFAILFDIASEEQKQEILEHVLKNEQVPQITTPYFKFYELDALGKMGCLKEVLSCIKSYWGGMLERGAVTFWEEYDPNVPAEEQYDMYGDHFGKSLCHAWAASPIYLLCRYFLGVQATAPGYEKYEVNPRTEFFRELDCTVPVNKGRVHISLKNDILEVKELTDEK